MSQGILRLGLTNQTYESFTVYIEFHVLFNHSGIYLSVSVLSMIFIYYHQLNIVMNSMASVVTTDYQSCKSNQFKKGSKNN